mgnify:CR=1 FL=1
MAWAGVTILGLLLLVAAAAAILLNSAWGHERIRQLIVSQSNRFLTGTLEIDGVSGSILRGIELDGVRLVQDEVPVITVGHATVGYSIPELYRGSTLIRRLRLERLQVVGAKDAEGRWNLGRLVRPRPPSPPNGRPPRLIAFEQIELVDSTIAFRDQLMFGAARVPRRFEHLNGLLSFDWRGAAWRLALTRAAWRGSDPELPMDRLTGVIATDEQGWTFEALRVQTPRSTYTVDGTVRRDNGATQLALAVNAERFAFQEWGGMLGGLRSIAVESDFTAHLTGPVNRMQTTIAMRSTGGGISGQFVLDSSVPGWHGSGFAEVQRLDLARWFNRPDRPSDITGRIDFDLDLDLGGHFPRGSYRFTGAHAAFAGYAADTVTAAGTLTATEAVIAAGTATAYGADVQIASAAIGIDAPYAYRFAGRAAGLDLRRVPKAVPVPHVESTLHLTYDVRGQFTPGFIVGRATFGASEFLGAQIAAGSVGSIDTGRSPRDRVRYGGEGELSGISLRRFGEGLDVAWMRDPRYDGVLAGHFHVDGIGADAATLALDGGGRLTRAEVFQGALLEADVDVHIANGSLRGSFDGLLDRINPARAFDDPRLVGSLSGKARATFAMSGLLVRQTTLADYEIDAHAELGNHTILRDLTFDQVTATAHLGDSLLQVSPIALAGAALVARGDGTIALDDRRESSLEFDITRGDLPLLTSAIPAIRDALGEPLSGSLSTQGHLGGTLSRPHVTGNARLTRVSAAGVELLSGGVAYDATIPTDHPERAAARLSGALGPLTVGSQALNELSVNAQLVDLVLTLGLRGTRAGGLNASLDSTMRLDLDQRAADLSRLALQVQNVAWQLQPASRPHLTWTDNGLAISDLRIIDAGGASAAGLWYGEFQVAALGLQFFDAADQLIDSVNLPASGSSGNGSGFYGITSSIPIAYMTYLNPANDNDGSIVDDIIFTLNPAAVPAPIAAPSTTPITIPSRSRRPRWVAAGSFRSGACQPTSMPRSPGARWR